MKELELWKFILKTISSGKKATLVVVAESSNSSPGRQGFKMAITEDAEQFGTIGGGIMEKDMIEYSLDLLFDNETKLVKKLYHTDKTKFEKSGLICGGYQAMIFSVIDKIQTTLIDNILSSISKKQNNELIISPGKIEYNATAGITSTSFTHNSDEDWQYKESTGLPLIAYISGGGHVGTLMK
jgi:xanthine dehydrogenase accessory factor